MESPASALVSAAAVDHPALTLMTGDASELIFAYYMTELVRKETTLRSCGSGGRPSVP